MPVIDEFELVGNDKERPFITLRNRSITFSKTGIEYLKFTPYVHMYLDRKGRRVAFTKSENDSAAIQFFQPPKEGRSVLVRISDKEKANMVMKIAQIQDCGKGIRYYGEWIPDEELLVFDLKDGQSISAKS